jgi:excisionase family DNA binding protein
MANTELLTREQAAKYLNLSPQTLAGWASTGRYGLRFVKLGKLARYRVSDLDEFVEARTRDGLPAKKSRRRSPRVRRRAASQRQGHGDASR